MKRREAISAGVGAALAALLEGCEPGGGVVVEEVSLTSLQSGLAAGRVTSRQLVDAYLRRIERVDRGGPGLNSVIELNPDALAIASERDAESRAGRRRGRLHGVPILIKDNIDTADRMKTTAGSLALVDAPAPKSDAAIVRTLRESGAVILGKTNLSEWANIRSSRSTSGWSARGGLTRNPYALDRNTSGSSSGSGAATAASLCAAAVGTETDGSVVSPSSINGLVGIKPAVDALPGAGIIPIAHSQDVAGPMARSVADAVELLFAMQGEVDPWSPGAARGRRIGVVRGLWLKNPDVARLAEEALDVLKRLGCELVDPVELPAQSEYGEAEYAVLMHELKVDMKAYLESRGGAMRSLADLIAFNQRNAAREMRYFGQEGFEMAEKTDGIESQTYRDARARCLKFAREGMDAAIEKQRLDALFAPTDSPAWPIDLINSDHFTGGASTPAAVAGYPHITVPGGQVYGLPVGMSFFGAPASFGVLLDVAAAFERERQGRVAPRYLPAVRYV